jgi:O-antigen ligase
VTAGVVSPRRFDPAVALLLTALGFTMVAVCSTALGLVPTLIGVGIPVAAAATLYAVRRPTVMLSAMVVIEVTNLAGVLAERIPLPVSRASLGLGMLTVAVALRDPVMRGRLNRGTVLCGGLVVVYLFTQFLAMVGSQSVDVSFIALKDSAVSCLFLVLILVLMQLTGKPWMVAGAIVAPLAVICVLCLISQVLFSGTASFGGFATVTTASGELITTLRFGGPTPDSNFWGRHLVLGVPLAGALIVRAVRSNRRWAAAGWAASLMALLAGVYLTQSRGTMIATAAALFVWVLASGPVARRRGLMSLPLVALVVLVPGIGNRMLALVADVSNPGSRHGVDSSVLGRMSAQEMAWAMFRDRPMFGFGPDVYEMYVPRYAGIVPTAVLHPTDAPHNLYAQLGAESGIVGLVGWTIFVGGLVVYLALRITRLSADQFGCDRSLGAAVLAGLVAWSLASVFLHLAYFRTFAIMLALAGALASAAVPKLDNEVLETVVEGWANMRREILATVFGIVAAAAVLAVTTTATHTVSQSVTMQPVRHVDGGDQAYALDIKTRESLLPTYAAMIAADARKVTAVADPVRGAITISTPKTDESSARTDLGIALAEARANLSAVGADAWYTLVPVGAPTLILGKSRSTNSTLIAVAVGMLVAAGTILMVRHSDTHQRGGLSHV